MGKENKQKKEPLGFYETVKRIKSAGLNQHYGNQMITSDESIPVEEKIKRIMDFLNRIREKRIDEMYCFIMYDIEDNKVRTYLSKYLIKKGCSRVQKSVFVASLSRKMYLEISKTVAEVNAMYDNTDSIFFLPIGEDVMNSLKMVGKNIDLDVVMNPPNTLFF